MKKILILLGILCVFASCKKDSSLAPDQSNVDSKITPPKKVNGSIDYIDSVYLTPYAVVNEGVNSWTTIRAWHKSKTMHVDIYLQAYASSGHNLPITPIYGIIPFVSLDPGPDSFQEFGMEDVIPNLAAVQNYYTVTQKQVTVKMIKVINWDTNEDITNRVLIQIPFYETVTYQGTITPTGPGVPPPGGAPVVY